MSKSGIEIDRMAELRRQSKECLRAGYDGHNRHPHPDNDMRELNHRRDRRRWHSIIRESINRARNPVI